MTPRPMGEGPERGGGGGGLGFKSHKVLGVDISKDPSWNVHVENTVKANKRLYALRALKKFGLSVNQLVQVYCSSGRSVLEYFSPVWAALPQYVSDAIESVQKRILRGPTLTHYNEGLIQCGIAPLFQRREDACSNFIKRSCLSSPLIRSLVPRETIDRRYRTRANALHPEDEAFR